MLPDASAAFYRGQQRRVVLTLRQVRAEWQRMGADWDRSWRTVGPRVTLLVGAAQLGAARDGVAYVPTVLAETQQNADADSDVQPRRFAGVASDGRPLGSLLYGAVVAAGEAFNRGDSVQQALAVGQRFLDMVAWTQIVDAGRGATAAGIVARPRLSGYVRMVNPPACARCVILAGRWYRFSRGFFRHPRCDCIHIPASEDIAGDLRTDPKALLEQGLVSGLTAAQVQALSDGADFSRVVNARRRMSTTQVESIYATAANRTEAIRGLRRAGYLN